MSTRTSTRDHIVDTADGLFYRQGYEHTSFADIAAAVQISRGNFYYHFKAKDEILDAVLELRMARRRELLARWEAQSDDPADRIRSFIQMWLDNRADISRYGCPIGTMCTELSKLDHPLQTDANRLLTLFRTWLRRQFELLGRVDDADDLAMQLLARSQGVAALSVAFGDAAFIDQEAERARAWLASCQPDASAK